MSASLAVIRHDRMAGVTRAYTAGFQVQTPARSNEP
jgi:hypothetical protein